MNLVALGDAGAELLCVSIFVDQPSGV